MAEDDNSKIKVSRKENSPSRLEGALKKKAYLLGIGAIVVVVGGVMLAMPGEKEKPEPPPSAFNIESGDISEQSWQIKAQASIDRANKQAREARQRAEAAQRRADKTKESIGDLRNAIKDLTRELNKRPVAKPEITGMNDDKDDKKTDTLSSESQADDVAEKEEATMPPLPPPPPLPPGQHQANQTELPPPTHEHDKPDEPETAEAIVFTPPNAGSLDDDEDEGTEADSKYVKNQYAGYLPTGSFADVAMLSGLDAAASAQNQANPQPVLMRVQNNAVTPGDGEYSIDNCFLIGSAYGDLSSERAYIRLTRISCVDTRREMLIESDISGYVTDSDGFLGLRGKLVQRNGQMLTKAILAGFASSIADVADSVSTSNSRAITTLGSGVGSETNTVDIDAGQLAKAGAFSGASNAADMIGKYYLDQAKAIFPVISIPPGRKGTVVITEGTSLRWHSTKGSFIKQVTPK